MESGHILPKYNAIRVKFSSTSTDDIDRLVHAVAAEIEEGRMSKQLKLGIVILVAVNIAIVGWLQASSGSVQPQGPRVKSWTTCWKTTPWRQHAMT